MEDLFEFLFGASGRINRAKYWRSFLIYIVAGLLAGVILLTAAGIAAPLSIIMVVVVLIPWLLWGFSITTERLHDRNKMRGGSWCFMGCRRCSASLRKPHGLPEQQARCSITSWLWPVLRSQSGDLSKSDSCAAPPGPTHMGPIRSCKLNGEAERQMQGGGGSDAGELAALLLLHGAPCAATRKRQIPTAPKNEKKPDGHQATGRGL